MDMVLRMIERSRLPNATKQMKMLAFAVVLCLLSWGATCQGLTDGDPALLHPKVNQSPACMALNTAEPSTPSSPFEDLPGFTRSVYEKDHALITPESQVWGSLLGWINAVGAILVTPAMGAHFVMFLAKMKGNSVSAPPQPGVERFVFVLSGSAHIKIVLPAADNAHHATAKLLEMQEKMFAYIPPGVDSELRSTFGADLVVFERKHAFREPGGDEAPLVAKIGRTDDEPTLDTPGEIFTLRKLLPQTPAYDFNIHIMDFQPGEYLNVKEVHYNQHGLLMLEGKGIYRLSNKWYPVQAGDAIWMAPFVPQWYAALGKTRTRYLLYKDVNRDPLLHFL